MHTRLEPYRLSILLTGYFSCYEDAQAAAGIIAQHAMRERGLTDPLVGSEALAEAQLRSDMADIGEEEFDTEISARGKFWHHDRDELVENVQNVLVKSGFDEIAVEAYPAVDD